MNTNELRRQPSGKMIPCNGEAHSNPFIDHCGCCVPHWGIVAELLPLNLDEARTKKMDVPFSELTEAQHDEVEADIRAGRAFIQAVTRKTGKKSSTNYLVARYV